MSTAEPWLDAPLVTPAATADPEPWKSAPLVMPAGPPQIPGAVREIAPRAVPTLAEKAVGGVQGALNTAKTVVEGLAGMFGEAGGRLGGLFGAASTALTGGVQPDDPRVSAGLVNPTPRYAAPTAFDEAGAQGAQTAIAGLNAADRATPLGGLRSALGDAVSTPGSDVAAEDTQSALEPVLQAAQDPMAPMTAGTAAGGVRPNAAARGAGVVDATLNAGRDAAGTVARAPGVAARGVARAVVKPDAELVKVAQINDALPHPLPLPAGKLSLDSKAGGNSELVKAADEATTRNVISLINPDETGTRLTPEKFRAAIDRSGGIIGDISDRTPAPVDQYRAALDPLVSEAARVGAGDAPRIIPNLAHDLLDKADDAGIVPGEAFRNWDSNLGKRIRATTDGQLRDDLMALQRAGRDTMARNLVDPADGPALKDARRQYAYAQVVLPGLDPVTGLIAADKLPGLVRATRRGKELVAKDAAGPLGDVAKAAQMFSRGEKASGEGLYGAAKQAAGEVAGAALKLTGTKAAVERGVNKASEGVRKMLTPKPDEPAAPPAPPELELAPQGALPARDGALPAGPLGDLTPDWETSRGAGGAAREGVDAAGLYPAVGEDLFTPELPRGAGPPGSQIPAVEGRPDLPDTMVSGRPGETAATDAGNAALVDPGAIEARRQQGRPPPEPPAPPVPPPKPKPTPGEQARLDEIDHELAGTQSDIVRETLTKARTAVEEEVAKRDGAEKTKAAADELRTAAARVTDPATRATLVERADKLDPPPKGTRVEITTTKPKQDAPVPTYEDNPEWRKAHGLGDQEAERALRTRQAYDLDPDAVEAAAVQHNTSPRAFDRAVDKILEKRNANELEQAPGSGEGPAGGAGQPGKLAGGGERPAGPDGAAARGTDGAQGQPARPTPEAVKAEAERRAKFEANHPRADDGTFTEKDPE